MRQLMGRLWTDDVGALISVEWVFVATIMILGCITGLVAVRQAIVTELEEFAEAILALSTSWCFHDRDRDDDDDCDRDHDHDHDHDHDKGHHKEHHKNHHTHHHDFDRNDG